MASAGKARKLRASGRLGRILLATLILTPGAVELVFRVVKGGPQGVFLGWFPGRLGLYPESATIRMPGVVPWTIVTNSWGIRGAEVSITRAPGVRRIAMVGDSVTDGFFVENSSTFPAFAAATLQGAGKKAEVISFARGGATIDTELAILREAVLRFKPDIVVLTFVTNDVTALEGLTDDQLLRRQLIESDLKRSLVQAVVTRTAAGEWAFDAYLRLRAPGYRSSLSEKNGMASGPGADRSVLPGGDDFSTNSRRFMERFKEIDGRILEDPLTPETEALVKRYLEGLDAFIDQARAFSIKPVFVYLPAYAQIYDHTIPTSMRRRLEEHCATRAVPFLDLTPALRSQGGLVMHLAPSDYHLNPDGNRVIGGALADFLIQSAF